MNFDPNAHLAATTRKVAFHDRDNKPASDVILSRTFDTGVDDIWDALTNSERLPRWFTNVTGDLQLNGRYHVEGNASGTITACEPQSHFALTWEFAGDTSWVEVNLDAVSSAQSRLTLTHTSHFSPHWDTYGPGATGVGWEMAFLGLALHIENPSAPKPDEMEFATSPDGKAFITGSSEAWGQAAIDAGTDPGVALAAARQTTAFYTGETIEPA